MQSDLDAALISRVEVQAVTSACRPIVAMRSVLVGTGCAAALAACAADVTRAVVPRALPTPPPPVAHTQTDCRSPTRVAGMSQIAPLEEQVQALWSLAVLPDAAYVEYWFEDERGDGIVGISDGARRWRAELQQVSGGAYVPKGDRWLVELDCAGDRSP